ncbi:MAG: L,D-transpeptidase [Myxococcales bacterium]
MLGSTLLALWLPAALPLWCAPGAAEALAAVPACLAPGEAEAGVEFVAAPFAASVHSLRLKRSATVREAPSSAAPFLGNVAQDMRVAWKRVALGLDCPLWVEIEPKGWLCSRHLEPSRQPPRLAELPRLEEDALVPGVYGKVASPMAKAYRNVRDAWRQSHAQRLKGSVVVRQRREVQVGRRRFWQTQAGQLIESRKIRELEPSEFSGVDLTEPSAPKLPLAFVFPPEHDGRPVPVMREPGRCTAPARWLGFREVVQVAGESPDGSQVRIGQGEWVAASDLRIARLSEVPEGVGDDERWLDVDLSQQVLVAYEGSRALYVTLVSTGAAHNPTPVGSFRIWVKMGETDMVGRMGKTPYRVEHVPWTAFFLRDFGLHAAYWHDRFGEPRSNGCVNLSPADAHALYFWTRPEVPAGWSMVYSRPSAPGSLVRIRRSEAGCPTPRVDEPGPELLAIRDGDGESGPGCWP